VEILHDQIDVLPSGLAVAATIGVFDGVHLGHQEVFRQVHEVADRLGTGSAVVTFDSHPAHVVRPQSAPRLLTTLDQKLELLAAQGLDYAFVIKFDAVRAATPPDQFVEQVFHHSLHARAIVVGEDFHFGKGRSGNVDELARLGNTWDFEVHPLELIRLGPSDKEPVSSTAIRGALADGEVARAAAMLGRPYEVRGVVQHGDERGRSIGFPTANIPVSNLMAWPADGVYAGWAIRSDGTRHACAINIGRRPTFHEDPGQSLLEAHLLDFDDDLYGESMAISFVEFLRNEQKFEGIDQLVEQLRCDIDSARGVLGLS